MSHLVALAAVVHVESRGHHEGVADGLHLPQLGVHVHKLVECHKELVEEAHHLREAKATRAKQSVRMSVIVEECQWSMSVNECE